MDERRFDDLVRTLGTTGRSRRAVLKGLMAGAVSGAIGLLSVGGAVAGNNGKGNGNGNSNSSKPDCCPPATPRLCGNHCVDFLSDASNCGGCGNICPDGATCQNGACFCPTGTTPCGNACVDTSSDNSNCGTCGNACQPGATCQGGTCVSAAECSSDAECPGGFRCTSGTCLDVCTNDFDCQVNFHCTTSGTCEPNLPGECSTGQSRPCYSGPAGTEGVGICTAGTQTCMAGGTWGPCVGEVLPQTETCNGLDDDCNGATDNGFDLQHDVNNCGACGHVCFTPNGVAGCFNGQCVVGSCNEGFFDCDGNAANGCETSVMTDNQNCGACGNSCGSGGICVNGVCTSNCPASTICLTITYNPTTGQCDQVPASAGTSCGLNQVCDGNGACVAVTGP